MKTSKTWGIIISIILIVFAVVYPVPEKKVDVSSSYSAYDNSWADDEGAEYIGGDAYNYQIEASLKAGYMSGVLALKGITFVGGILLLFHTLFLSAKYAVEERQAQILSDLKQSSEEQKRILNQLSEQLSKFAIERNDDDGKEEAADKALEQGA